MNRVTAAERERILTRAKALQHTGVSYGKAISQIQTEFSISRDRARRAVTKALRQSRHRRTPR